MAIITIKDLRTDRILDHKAMSVVWGGNRSWVINAFRPYRRNTSPFGPGSVINFNQINNDDQPVPEGRHQQHRRKLEHQCRPEREQHKRKALDARQSFCARGRAKGVTGSILIAGKIS